MFQNKDKKMQCLAQPMQQKNKLEAHGCIEDVCSTKGLSNYEKLKEVENSSGEGIFMLM